MAVSSTKTVYEIFQSMEYGPAATSSTATAQVQVTFRFIFGDCFETKLTHSTLCCGVSGNLYISYWTREVA